MTNHLFYGDNLQVLRNEIRDETVDLVYLDPPFNSQANYNVLFRSPTGTQSQAQIEAFEDTWHWNQHAETAFDEVLRSGNGEVAEMLRAFRTFLKENDMMAYLTVQNASMLNRAIDLELGKAHRFCKQFKTLRASRAMDRCMFLRANSKVRFRSVPLR